MQNEKEQEMTSPANPTEAQPNSQRDLQSLEILDTEFNSRPVGEYTLLYTLQSSLTCLSSFNFHTCVSAVASSATKLPCSVLKWPDFQWSPIWCTFSAPLRMFFSLNCSHIHSDLFMSVISSLIISPWEIWHLHSFIRAFPVLSPICGFRHEGLR